MKALTLTQPWATLVATGAKRIETRSWYSGAFGPLAIHAAKGFPRDAMLCCRQEPFRSALTKIGIITLSELPRGAVLCIVDFTYCERVLSPGQQPPEPERSFGDFSMGRWAWHFKNIRRFPEPIPARGRLGIWNWDPPGDVERLIDLWTVTA